MRSRTALLMAKWYHCHVISTCSLKLATADEDARQQSERWLWTVSRGVARLSNHIVSCKLKSEGQDSPLMVCSSQPSQAKPDTLTDHSALSHESDTLTQCSALSHRCFLQDRLHTKLRDFQSDHEIIEIGSRTAPWEDLSSSLSVWDVSCNTETATHSS